MLSAPKSLIGRRGALWIESFEKVVEIVPKQSTLSRQICRHGHAQPTQFWMDFPRKASCQHAQNDIFEILNQKPQGQGFFSWFFDKTVLLRGFSKVVLMPYTLN